jgi:hypothetical protein
MTLVYVRVKQVSFAQLEHDKHLDIVLYIDYKILARVGESDYSTGSLKVKAVAI